MNPQPTTRSLPRGSAFFSTVLLATAGSAAVLICDGKPAAAITLTINNFTDVYAVSNWTSLPGTGSISTAGAPSLIALTSGNNGSGSASQTAFRIVAQGTGRITFRWRFSTSDRDGPTWDPFGYTLNSVFTQLSSNSGGANQNGTASVPVVIGDIFQFTQITQDNLLGSATTRIDRFTAPKFVPAAGPGVMLVPLMAALTALRRRYRPQAQP
jgi:hypothetical protein